MPCYHPLKALDLGENPITKKKILKFLQPKDFMFGEYANDDRLIDIPCGQCIGCRMAYAQQWANRLLLELQDHDPDKCFFVTLTYDDPNVLDRCLSEYNKPDSDKKGYSLSLRKKDLQDFMKRLRRELNLKYVTVYGEYVKPSEFDWSSDVLRYQRGKRKGQPKEFYLTTDNIRFYGVGEYGKDTFRPHLHLILFNLNLPDGDLRFYKKSPLGYNYSNSDIISKCWPYGYNVVAPVTWESCCYCARYMLKKQKGENAHVYSDFGLETPFAVCSRKPGIAHSYYENCGDFSEISRIVVGSKSGSRSFPPPRYLEKLFEFDEPEKAAERRKIRQLSAKNREKIVLSKTHVSKDKYLENMENNFTKATNLLYNYRCLV